MQAIELSRWGKSRFHRGRLQSWTGTRPPGKPKDPCPHPSNSTGFPSFRAIQADVLKGMISYRIWFLECEHKRASNGQHARKRLFNDSFAPCQALIRINLADWHFYEVGPEIADLGVPNPVGQWFARKERLEIGDHAVLHRDMRLNRMAADMGGQHDIGH